jgi:hypothetical protein
MWEDVEKSIGIAMEQSINRNALDNAQKMEHLCEVFSLSLSLLAALHGAPCAIIFGTYMCVYMYLCVLWTLCECVRKNRSRRLLALMPGVLCLRQNRLVNCHSRFCICSAGDNKRNKKITTGYYREHLTFL